MELFPNNDVVIANQPAVSDYENTPQKCGEAGSETGLPNLPTDPHMEVFPLNMHKLVEASSDSSWGSSSICSSLSDLTEQPKV